MIEETMSDAKTSGLPPIVTEARKRLDAAHTADRDNREQAAEDLAFVAGDQWDAQVRRVRENDGRPCLTIDRLSQFIRQTTNDIRQNAPAIKTIPADGASDKAIAEIFTGMIRQIQYQSSAKNVYATAAEHSAICGIGHFRIDTDYIEDSVFEQEIKISRISNPLSVYWDPASVEPDRSDANWCLVTERVPQEDFKARYPDADEIEFDAPQDTKTDGLYWTSDEGVLIAEYWRKVPAKRTLAAIPGEDSGGIMTVDITDLDDVALAELPPIIGQRDVETNRVEQYVVSGAQELEPKAEWAGKYIPIIPVIGAEIPLDDKTVRKGMVRSAKDTQVLYNYARSSATEAIAQAPKSPYLVTEKQIGKYKALWDTANSKLRNYLLYEPDPKANSVAPTRERPADPPSALWTEAELAERDMQATIGIYDAGLGERSNETSGKAIIARQREGDTANFHFGDNLAHSLTHAGRILVDLIPKIYDTARTVRIMGEDDSEDFVEINQSTIADNGEPILLNDLSAGRFDVRVTIGPSYSTKRIEAADSMMAFAQANPQAAPLIADLIAKNQDWPGSEEMAKRLKTLLPPEIKEMEAGEDDAPPPPPDPMQQHVQQMELQAGQEKLRALQLANMKTEAEITEIMNRSNAQPTPSEPIDLERDALEKDKIAAETEKTRASAIHELAKADAADGVIGNLMTQGQHYEGATDRA